MSHPSPPAAWSATTPPPAAAPPDHRARAKRRLVVALAGGSLALLVTAGTTLGVLLYRSRAEVTRLDRERIQARDELRVARDDLSDVRRQLASSQEDVQTLNAKLGQAPSQATCSSVRFPAGWDHQEKIIVICGPHARDASDAVVEYRIGHDQVTGYLHTHYPLNVVLLDLNFSDT